jgi:hypothetical protein
VDFLEKKVKASLDELLPNSPEKEQALLKLRESIMWARGSLNKLTVVETEPSKD